MPRDAVSRTANVDRVPPLNPSESIVTHDSSRVSSKKNGWKKLQLSSFSFIANKSYNTSRIKKHKRLQLGKIEKI